MRGATIRAERALRARLRDEASRRLGTDATKAAIEEMTDRLYLGPQHKDANTRTPMERRREERMREAARNAFARNRNG